MSPIMKYQWISFHIMFFACGGLVLFLYGFFPMKYHGGPEATWDDLPADINGISLDRSKLYVGNKTRVILMVIDALRYDFVSSKYMPYTADLISNGSACLYKAQAQPPTVTMPRIKSSLWKRDKAQWRRTINFWRDVFAMTTGSVSNFIDVALNFGSSAVTEDSFLNQARRNNKKMVFYGDDTWLRLFPDVFKRSEGTTSFFVSDYTEVDLNVTRHLDQELGTIEGIGGPDWDLMVLHYLGLDHIGHLEGPASPKVYPKMAEMDTVVTRIMEAAKNWKGDTVLVICGDHGMKDSGSHGGASYSEITVPLVITQSNGCFNKHPSEVDQVDIAPTMSYLLGLPIPSASTGQILPQVLGDGKKGDLSTPRALYALYYNAKNNINSLFKILGEKDASHKDCYSHYQQAVRHHHDYLSNGKGSRKTAATFYLSSMNNMAKFLNELIVEFDLFAIVIGIFIILQSFVAQFLVMILSYQPKTSEQYSSFERLKKSTAIFGKLIMIVVVLAISISVFTISCGVTQTNSSLCRMYPVSLAAVSAIIVIIVSNTVIIMFALKDIHEANELSNLNPIEMFLIAGTIIHALTFGGTSFIEEEHQTWYFFWVSAEFFVLVYTGSVLVDYIRKRNENATEIQDKADLAYRMNVTGRWLLPQWVLLMLLHRFLRTLNQTGDKWAFLPDTGDWLNEEENKNILSPLAIIAIVCIGLICVNNLDKTNSLYKINFILTIVATLCVFTYRVTTLSIHVPFYFPAVSDILIVRIFWIAIFAMMVTDIWSSFCFFYNGKSDKKVMQDQTKYDALRGENSPQIQSSTMTYRNTESSAPVNYDAYVHPSAYMLSVSEVPSGLCVKMQVMTSRTNTFLNIMILVCSLLLRPHNLILVPSLYMTSKTINSILDYKLGSKIFKINTARDNSESKNIFCKTIFHIWIGAIFYFYQGNSNSLASIDLGSGYIGLESYIPVVVALQMGIHTYTGPLLAGLFLFVDCVRGNKQYDKFMNRLSECIATISVVRIYPIVVYTIVTALLRYHLFVWTVFSPKLLYDFTLIYFCLSSILTMVIICKSVTMQEKINSYLSRNSREKEESYQPKHQ